MESCASTAAEIEVNSELGKGARFGLSFPELALQEMVFPEEAVRLEPLRVESPPAITTAVVATAVTGGSGIPAPASVPAMQVAQSDRVTQ